VVGLLRAIERERTMWVLVGSFFVILLGLILVHAKVNGGFKIETSWVAIALSPAVLSLLATGQLAEFSGFGLAFKLREASAKTVSLKVDGSKIEPVSLAIDEKRGVENIPELIRKRVAALRLQVGRRNYYAPSAIGQYLEELTKYDFFRYVIFVGGDEKFRGLVPAKTLLEQMRRGGFDIVRVIEEGSLNLVDGLVSAAVPSSSNKRDALKRMDELNLAELPVVDEAGRFLGVIERDKVTSSIVLDLVARP